MNSNRDKINIEELERLSANKVYDFIDGVTNDMAQQSDVGGDSDAEDTVLVSIPGSPGTSCSSIVLTPDPSISSIPGPSTSSRRSVRNKKLIDFENQLSDFDSDDSLADKNYVPEKKRLKKAAIFIFLQLR
ncbi:unnamed protein product [Brassicogethes aeneus]|uniref:Uncharacterized protein n=1 Tax=Brassicogethes aeneus TaxID=1431903 RepID=A0A9P0FNP9_BRAAE|nr:unnamed protein product [Brassicogethes aeneus]